MEFVRYAHSAILAKGQFTWRCGTPDRRGRSPHLSCKHYQIKMLISSFLEIDFEINISDKKSRRFDLSEVIFKCIKVL